MVNRSLYIHIPFCRKKCLYCDFYSTIHDVSSASHYIDVILAQIKAFENQAFKTIYIGGGTPTVLQQALLKRLVSAVRPFMLADGEFTVEANPESLTVDKIKTLLDAGVNRISIGVQSFNDKKLKRLGRVHDARRAEEAVVLASKNGFKNIGLDLIYGAWCENSAEWMKDLDKAVKLPIKHISCYSLTYEKTTPLFEALKNNSIVPLEDDTVAGMYETAIDRLSLDGLKQYEVSNFAKAGFECRHNLNYWDNGEYVGLGVSAVSYIDGNRAKNISDIGEYTRRVESGRPVKEVAEKLTPIKKAKETAAVKIRTKEGIDFAWFKSITGFDFLEIEKKAVAELIDKDLIKYKREGDKILGICLKRKGFLFCDTVSSALV